MQAHMLQVQLQQHVLLANSSADEPTWHWHVRHRSCTVQEAWRRHNMFEGFVALGFDQRSHL